MINVKDIVTLVVAGVCGFIAAPVIVGYVVDHSTTMSTPTATVVSAEETETARTKALTGEALRLDMIRTLCQTKDVVCK